MGVQRQVFIGLGSNLGDRLAALREARAALTACLVDEAVSSVWDTAPEMVTDQPRFLNAVISGRTEIDPFTLLAECKRIERVLGRTPERRYGPRRIDLDLLLYGAWKISSVELTVPHPLMAERVFVLAPLAELAPDLEHPVLGVTVGALFARVGRRDVRREAAARL